MVLLEVSQWDYEENSTRFFCHGPSVDRDSRHKRVSKSVARGWVCQNLYDPNEKLCFNQELKMIGECKIWNKGEF